MAGKNRSFQKILLGIGIALAFTSFILAGLQGAASAPIPQADPIQEESGVHLASQSDRASRREIEQFILETTIIIEMHAQVYFREHRNVRVVHSHATVLAGRYLVTHNHFNFSLEGMAAEGQDGYIAISLRRTNGRLILDTAPLSAFTIVYSEPQTLVLEFLDGQGDGLFAANGIPSAIFADWSKTQLDVGSEVAQVDWDGKTAHVDWVEVAQLAFDGEVPHIQVDNFARTGSSGGGVFFDGQHIGNTWARNIEQDTLSDEISRRYTMIALDSLAIRELDR